MFRFSLFVLLSVCDLALTGWMLANFRATVYEVNPVANWLFENLGWMGFVFFKITMVATVIAIIFFIQRRRPVTAKRLLNFACLAVALVLSYSLYVGIDAAHLESHKAQIHKRKEMLAARSVSSSKHKTLVKRLSHSLISGELTLREAVVAVERSEKARNNEMWAKIIMRIYQCDSRSCAFAAYLIHAVSAELDGRNAFDKDWTIENLDREFTAVYQKDRPIPRV